MGDELLVELTDSTAVVTLNRPHARNALNDSLRRDLRTALTGLEQDPSVAVVVLTGADPAFCAGLDLKELARAPGSLGGGLHSFLQTLSDL